MHPRALRHGQGLPGSQPVSSSLQLVKNNTETTAKNSGQANLVGGIDGGL
jgi:hypothetical protein